MDCNIRVIANNLNTLKEKRLFDKYPPSEPCGCEICASYCKRPGWWTPKQAFRAINVGYAARMMLEISPELTFGVLSPAFRGCEGRLAVSIYSGNGCTFYVNGSCELHDTVHKPLECRFCHHERLRQGQRCHLDIEKLWMDGRVKRLVEAWGEMVGLWDQLREVVSQPCFYRRNIE